MPDFEGKPVHGTMMLMKGLNKVACDDRVLRVDSIVKLEVEARVTGVHHVVDEQTGKLERVQVVKAIDVEFGKFDPTNPDDNGVVQ